MAGNPSVNTEKESNMAEQNEDLINGIHRDVWNGLAADAVNDDVSVDDFNEKLAKVYSLIEAMGTDK